MSDRPIYETDVNISNEESFGDKLISYFKCTLHKLPIKYHVDYMLQRNNKLEAWLEIKCRKTYSEQYSEYMLSLDKWLNGNRLAKDTGVPFILAVRFTDCDMILDCRIVTDPIVKFQGRTKQTRDWQDIEPTVFIPMKYFKKV